MDNLEQGSVDVNEMASLLLAKSEPKEVEEVIQEDLEEDNLADELEADVEDLDLDDTEESEEGEDTEEFEEEQLYTVKIDGKEEHVTLEELQSGYMKEGDYRSKTEAVAQERKALEEERKTVADLQNIRKDSMKELQILHDLNSKPLYSDQQLQAILKEQGSDQYLLAKQQEEQRQKRLSDIKQRHGTIEREFTEEEKKEHAKTQERERAALKSVMPELFDPENEKKVMTHLLDMGFDSNLIANTTDHRYFVIAEESRRYREMMASKKSKSVKKIPKVTKKSGKKNNSGDKRLSDLKKRAVRTGSARDIAQLIEAKRKS